MGKEILQGTDDRLCPGHMTPGLRQNVYNPNPLNKRGFAAAIWSGQDEDVAGRADLSNDTREIVTRVLRSVQKLRR